MFTKMKDRIAALYALDLILDSFGFQKKEKQDLTKIFLLTFNKAYNSTVSLLKGRDVSYDKIAARLTMAARQAESINKQAKTTAKIGCLGFSLGIFLPIMSIGATNKLTYEIIRNKLDFFVSITAIIAESIKIFSMTARTKKLTALPTIFYIRERIIRISKTKNLSPEQIEFFSKIAYTLLYEQ